MRNRVTLVHVLSSGRLFHSQTQKNVKKIVINDLRLVLLMIN